MADEEMIDETETEEDETFAPEESEGESRSGRGPGFIRGVLFGLIAGAGAATLLAPTAGKELRDRIAAETTPVRGYGSDPDAAPGADAERTPVDRIRALLAQVRARVLEAKRAAAVASREAEELSHARYAELTRQGD